MTEQRLNKIIDAVKRAVRGSSKKKKYGLNLTAAGFLINSVFKKAKETGVNVAVDRKSVV